MRVLYLTNSLGFGGIEQNLVRLTRELVGRGHDVTVASRPGPLVASIEGAGARHVELQVRPRSIQGLRSDRRTIRKLLADTPPDVIHNMAASTAVMLKAAFAGSRRRIPVVASIMGLHAAPNEPRLWSRARAWVTALGADRLVLISPAISRMVRSLPGLGRRSIEGRVVGVELPEPDFRNNRRGPTRRALGVADDRAVVVTIGRLAPDKSHELAVRAAARLAQAGGVPALWWIIGEGAERSRIEEEIERLGVGDHVELMGERSDVLDLIAAADVCLKPGIVEGFVGITVLEAQSIGTPVVAFDTEDVRMAIEPGISGLIVPRGDVDALAAAVRTVLENRRLAEGLAEGGRKAVRRFDISRVVDELLNTYRALCPAVRRGS